MEEFGIQRVEVEIGRRDESLDCRASSTRHELIFRSDLVRSEIFLSAVVEGLRYFWLLGLQ